MLLASLLLGTFLIGSIPSGVLLARAFGYSDPRSFGSGNIGASNLTRLGGKKLGALTFLCDFSKGLIPVGVAHFLFPAHDLLPPALVISAVLGHCYSVFLSFEGGKGVATTAGALIALHPLAVCVGLITWIFVFFLERISSTAAMVALMAILVTLAICQVNLFLFTSAAACSLIVIRRHESNLEALLNSAEKRFD